MLRCEDRAGAARSVCSQTLVEQACLTEHGLVFGAGSVLARMTKGVGARVTVDADAERIVALLSVAAGRPLSAATVVPHVSAAAEHWRRGDKALAQLRLAVGRLPRLSCAADAWRMAIAEHLLDAGVPPATLMAELWPDACGGLAKTYDPEEPRDWRGRWAREWSAEAPSRPGPRPVQVAMEPGSPDEDEKHFQERERTGLATIGEEAAHGRAIDIAGGLGGAGRISDAEAALVTIRIPLSRFGEAAQHVIDAQEAGHPDTVTIARDKATANRAAATGGLSKVPGMHLDEYPPAMFNEGGPGASVRPVKPSDNTGLGGYIGGMCRKLPNGVQIKLKVEK